MRLSFQARFHFLIRFSRVIADAIGGVLFPPNQQIEAVIASEARHRTAAVLMDPGEKVGGHTDVQGAVTCRREEIDRGLEVFAHDF